MVSGEASELKMASMSMAYPMTGMSSCPVTGWRFSTALQSPGLRGGYFKKKVGDIDGRSVGLGEVTTKFVGWPVASSVGLVSAGLTPVVALLLCIAK